MKGVKGKIITIASTKGGVGKTITTLNLAGVYSSLGYKTLVIDLDLYGGAVATYLNSDNDKTIFNLALDMGNNRYEKMEDYIYSYSDNLDIISAPKDPRMASKIDAKYIPILLNNVVYKYDVILIDTFHIINEINIMALDNSDAILYMLTNDTFDLKNSRSFMSIMKDINYDNYYTVLNLSVHPDQNYYSSFDIRSLIGTNIDFTISRTMYVKNIDKYILDGEILVLNKKFKFLSKKDKERFRNIALKLIEKGDNENA